MTDDLERLVALHRSGALSDAEFESAKARVLGSAPHPGVDGVVRWLHALRRSLSAEGAAVANAVRSRGAAQFLGAVATPARKFEQSGAGQLPQRLRGLAAFGVAV